MSGLAFIVGGIPFAVFLAATAAVVLRTAALPRWLGWSAAVIAIAFPATLWSPNDAAQIPHLLLDLWMLAASVTLICRRESAYADSGRTAEAHA